MSALSLASRPAPQVSPDVVRVAVVDDAVVVRGMVSRWVTEEDGLALAGSYRNGKVAVENIARERPDVIILDIEMPEMDGLTALPLLLKAVPGARIVMASTLTRRNAEVSLKAMSLGAADYIPKPESNSGVSTSADFRRDLMQKVHALGGKSARRTPGARAGVAAPAASTSPASGPGPAGNAAVTLRSYSRVSPGVLVIGSSTGGPPALASLVGALSGDVWRKVPVLIAQHMPATFTAILAEHLTRAARIPAAEAIDGERVMAGRIYVAPGGKHMLVGGTRQAPVIKLTDDAPVHFCKPAVDPMFDSVAGLYGSATLAVVLTGMGSDGALAAGRIADAGGTVLAQDKETSVVWGMPGATAQAGACAALMPVDRIAAKINELVKGVRA